MLFILKWEVIQATERRLHDSRSSKGRPGSKEAKNDQVKSLLSRSNPYRKKTTSRTWPRQTNKGLVYSGLCDDVAVIDNQKQTSSITGKDLNSSQTALSNRMWNQPTTTIPKKMRWSASSPKANGVWSGEVGIEEAPMPMAFSSCRYQSNTDDTTVEEDIWYYHKANRCIPFPIHKKGKLIFVRLSADLSALAGHKISVKHLQPYLEEIHAVKDISICRKIISGSYRWSAIINVNRETIQIQNFMNRLILSQPGTRFAKFCIENGKRYLLLRKNGSQKWITGQSNQE